MPEYFTASFTTVEYFSRSANELTALRLRLVYSWPQYLAAKVEEHTVTAQKIINQLNLMYKGDHSYPYAVADIYDYEFRLISELDFDLVVFHPYRALMRYCSGSPLNSILRGAWAMVNDSYR